jgi:hypothetical protein
MVLLKQHSKSPPTSSKIALDQVIKGCYLSIHNAALLAEENADLRVANEKKRQTRTRSNRKIPHEGGLTVEEASQLIEQPIQAVKPVEQPPPGPVEPHILSPASTRRRQARYNGCQIIGHSITWGPNK